MLDKLVTLDLDQGEPVVQAYLPENTRQKNALRKVKGLRHFDPIERYGFNPRLRCWCGTEIEIDYAIRPGLTLDQSINTMSEDLRQFHLDHMDCEPKEVQA